MAYENLREWIAKLESEGELARIKTKVNWDLEIGGIVQEVFDTKGPALLFENIKDHENTICKKLFTASLSTYSRIALMLGLPKDTPQSELIQECRERMKNPIKPVMVETGPVKENILKGDQVDLFQFPAPRWHDMDGGRYIGTCDGVVTKDPETGWVNIGLYRRMIHDRNHTGITIIHGQDIWKMWRKYRKLGYKTMPIAMINGWDPVLAFSSSTSMPEPEYCEYDLMGALRQKPVELVKCETVDLEVPANCEIVIEGELLLDFDSFRTEGPFGEYSGYYGSVASKKPVIRWNCITHRNDPILQGTMEGVPINEDHCMLSVSYSALLWDHLNKWVSGVTAVNVDPAAYVNAYIQIDNSYIGQVQQVAFTSWVLPLSGHMWKNIMVVDEDIDVFNYEKLSWAFGFRVDPPRDIIMIPGAIGTTDPVKHPDERVGQTTIEGTRLLIDATKYFGNPRTDKWFGEKFSPVCYPDEETMKLVRNRWKEYGIK